MSKQRLINMANSARIPHAQLFLGPEGCGKLGLALAFAQYVLCEHKQEQTACGECSNCIKSSKFIHPDIHFSFPTVGTKVKSISFLPQWREMLSGHSYFSLNDWLTKIEAENKQGNINAEECRSIIQKLSLKTFEGKYKILILWLPELLGKEGNRLLKLIEEPPENTLFLLVAENQELILNTILSRCQLFKVNPLRDEDIVEGLLNQGIPESRVHAIAYLVNGNFKEALSMIEQEENDNANLFLDWMRLCWKIVPSDLIKWIDSFAKIGRKGQKQFFTYGLFFLREYTVLKLTGNENIRLRPKELETAKRFTKVVDFEQIEPMMQLFDEAILHIERNGNPKIIMMDCSIQMNKIFRKNLVAT